MNENMMTSTISDRPVTETGCRVFDTKIKLDGVQDFALAFAGAPTMHLSDGEGLASYKDKFRTKTEGELLIEVALCLYTPDAATPPLRLARRQALHTYGVDLAEANEADEKADRLSGLRSFWDAAEKADALAMVSLARVEELFETSTGTPPPPCMAWLENSRLD